MTWVDMDRKKTAPPVLLSDAELWIRLKVPLDGLAIGMNEVRNIQIDEIVR